jgi:hypothetical protein
MTQREQKQEWSWDEKKPLNESLYSINIGRQYQSKSNCILSKKYDHQEKINNKNEVYDEVIECYTSCGTSDQKQS